MADSGTSNRKIAKIEYTPGLQDTGDLEAGTKTVTATSKPGSPDYTSEESLAVPPEGIVVDRTFGRLDINITAFNAGATKLNFSLEINGVEKLSGFMDAPVGGKAASSAWGDLGAGGAWTVTIYLWADQDTIELDAVQFRFGVGNKGTTESQVVHYVCPLGAIVSDYAKLCRNESDQHPRLRMNGVDIWGDDTAGSDITREFSAAYALSGNLEWNFTIDTEHGMNWLDKIVVVHVT